MIAIQRLLPRLALIVVLGLYSVWSSPAARAETVESLGDVETFRRIAIQSGGAILGSSILFGYDNPATTGTELYKLDGSVISLVKDINPGSNGSFPNSLVVAGGKVFFVADDGVHGFELWISDGTAAGTTLVRDIFPGQDYGSISSLVAVGSRMAATIYHESVGNELLVSDGTLAGTNIIELQAGPTSSAINYVTRVNDNVVVFSGNDSVAGNEPFFVNLTVAPITPILIRDIEAGPSSSFPFGFAAAPLGNAILFSATSVANGTELYFSTGTPAGTQLIDINPGAASSTPFEIVFAGLTAYFTADRDTEGRELWKTDGSIPGTQLVADIRPGTESSNLEQLVALPPSSVVFRAFTDANGIELWGSNGTPGGTTILRDMAPGTESGTPSVLGTVGNRVIFSGPDPFIGNELWATDGTAVGTTPLRDIAPGVLSSNPSLLASSSSKLYFSASDSDSQIVIETGGSPADTNVAAELSDPSSSEGSFPFGFTKVGSRVYFGATTRLTGSELFSFNLGSRLTTLVNELLAGEQGTNPSFLNFSSPNVPLVSANSPSVGNELFKISGSGELELVADIHPGSASANPNALGYIGNKTILYATTAASGRELYSSDGTTAGTSLVRDITPGAGNGVDTGGSPRNNPLLNGRIFFVGRDAAAGGELWSTDGTNAGTTLVKDIRPGGTGSSPTRLFASPELGAVFFRASDGVAGSELWKTDGTAGGTTMITDLNPGALSSSPEPLGMLNGRLIFFGSDGVNGQELWSTDGTAAGTVLLRDIAPGSSGSSPRNLTRIGNRAIFTANDGNVGTELWITDGSAAGTVLLKDIFPGAEGSFPGSLLAVDDVIYFRARASLEVGNELWRTDGTTQGTILVQDIEPALNQGSALTGLTLIDGYVYLSAFTLPGGSEPFRFLADECPSDPSKRFVGACGCGVADTDSDSDGTPDCLDQCALDAAKVSVGQCGCGVSETDTLSIGIADCLAGKKIDAIVDATLSLVNRMKVAKTAAQRKTLKAQKAQLVTLVNGLVAFAKANGAAFGSLSTKSLSSNLSATTRARAAFARSLSSSSKATLRRALSKIKRLAN